MNLDIDKQVFLRVFDTFPPELQKEVIDFTFYLRERRAKERPSKKSAKKLEESAEELEELRSKIEDLLGLQFSGMWEGRDEMNDSVAWVERVRNSGWERQS